LAGLRLLNVDSNLLVAVKARTAPPIRIDRQDHHFTGV
jgi:hypothetical protein